MVATLYVHAAIFLQSATTSTWSLQSMWSTMSTLPRVVVGILFVLSVYSFGVMIDRALMYSAARKQSRVFVQQVAGALKEGKLDEAIAIAERNKKSHIAKVVATGLSEFQSASQQVSYADVIEAAKRGLERSVAIVHAEMKRGLSALATIGSTPAVVGVFCTVGGILNAFKGIESNKATGLSAVAGGIAEALVTTAFGLLVAVPAVWAYNYFTNKVEAFDVEMDNSSMDLITSFTLRRGAKKYPTMAYKPVAGPQMAAPNVIPMADIMLVLLIIFMVVTPMLQKGQSVDMVRTDNPRDMQDADKDDAIIVAITRDGKIYLGNTQMPKEDLTGQIKDRISTRLDKTVYVKSDARAKYGEVVAVVDEIRSAGVDQLGLLTEKNQKNGPPPPPPAD